ncbi:glycosyltransferase [Colwelliaceae bacterium MEBiC 14330]
MLSKIKKKFFGVKGKAGLYDGFLGGALSGWVYGNSAVVTIYINGAEISSLKYEDARTDVKEVLGKDAVGFSFIIDGSVIDYVWLFAEKISVKIIVDSNSAHKEVLIDTSIETQELVDSIEFYQGVSLVEIEQLISNSMLWNERFYLNQMKERRISCSNLIRDYVLFGSQVCRDPSEYFSNSYYMVNNPDVLTLDINPLYHYLVAGEQEGRSPNPYFDPKVYLEQNPDLASWDSSLLAHYTLFGRTEGRHYCERRQVKKTASINTYSEWINNNEKLAFNEVFNNLRSFKKEPLVSIVVPVYNPKKELLIECIKSVINQSYKNWELCLADDKSSQQHVREVLEEYASKDKRIKPIFREKNGHISAASNSALEVSTGEWMALLDHDDELHEHALYHVVKALNEKPDTEFIYSDEDKISEEGNRIDPHFKSNWNLDLLYSQNYVSHLGVYKTEIINKIGGFRLGYEGSQDYDLLLRYSREIDHANIVHIPKVLYHWRMVQGSTALASGEKSYTTDAGIKALQDHFKVLKKNVTVEQGKHANIYKVNWPSVNDQNKEPLVTLIIPTYNGYEITKQAIDSILEKSTYQNFEILLVDNNSDDEIALAYFDELNQHEKVTVLCYPYPFNYSAINNFAAKQAKGEIIGLINNDVEVINPEWLTEMVSHALREDIGCVGAMLYFENDTIQHAGVITGIGGVAGHSHKNFKRDDNGYFSRLKVVQNLSAVTAACLLVRKSVFDEVSGLNEKDLTVAFNDVDFCLKVQAKGYRNLWTPYAELYHYESISRGAEDNPEKIARFNKEVDYMKEAWEIHVKADSCYSPNLTNKHEDFSLGE